jgi:GNAT superfamily N-acetyltransferase
MFSCEGVGGPAGRARDWVRSDQAAVSDVMVPWAHGTIVRSTRFPNYYSYNLVRVESDPGMDADELIAFAGEALAPLPHRRLDFEVNGSADRLRSSFSERGWSTDRLLWMRHEAPAPGASRLPVSEVGYDAIAHLREAWHAEDGPADADHTGFLSQAREVALARGARVLAVLDGERAVAFAQLHTHAGSTEITHVYVDPRHRGRGLGTSLTAGAIELAGAPRDLWICADAEGRPKDLYRRLGFRGVWTSTTFELAG